MRGLSVTGCRIESIVPTAEFGAESGQANAVSGGIFSGADPHPPSATQLGKPENFSGILAILNNDIDVGAPSGAQTLGIIMFNVGRSPDKEVDIYVSGNLCPTRVLLIPSSSDANPGRGSWQRYGGYSHAVIVGSALTAVLCCLT